MRNFLTLLLLLPVVCQAQIGGQAVYDFLNLTPSARVSALGGVNISTIDEDVNMGYQNPALVTDSMHHRASVSYASYLGDIGYGYAAYSRTIGKIGSFHSGIHYVNYGKIQGADEFGNLTEEFGANEIAWVIGLSRALKNFRYGVNMKLINSTLASGLGYSSFGMAFDIGGAYISQNQLFSAGIVAKNLGFQFSPYSGTGHSENLPFELQVGVSNKLKYMPVRFSATVTHLEHPNLIFEDPDKEPEFDLSGNEIKDRNPIVDKIARHFVFSTEFYLGKAIRVRAGYNHLRRQELRAENRGGLTGFSLGAGLRISKFALDYGFVAYGSAAAFNNHHISITMDLNRRTHKKG